MYQLLAFILLASVCVYGGKVVESEESQWSRLSGFDCTYTNNSQIVLEYVAEIVNQSDYYCGNASNFNLTSERAKGRLLASFTATLSCSLFDAAKKSKRDPPERFAISYNSAALALFCGKKETYCVEFWEISYCRLVEFLFQRENSDRQDFCDEIDHRTHNFSSSCKSDTLASWGGRCNTKEGTEAYNFSWYLLVMSALNNNSQFDDNAYYNSTKNNSWAAEMSKQVLSDVRFKSIYREMSVFYVLSSETLRKFMTTTLLMHNFGRSIRTTQKLIDHHCQKAHLSNHKKKNNTNGKYMKIACHQDELYSRERYTIGYKDLWTLVSLENFRCCLMGVLIALGIVVNCYMLFLLKIAYLSANRTFVQLAIMFSLSNLLFLIVNAWMISQQFWPVIAEQQTANFFLIENYDGDLFWNTTYFAAASGLRLIMNNRYAHNPEDFNSSSQTWILHLLLVGEDLLLNCSRSIGAVILLLLMYNLLYELRASFCGRLSYKLLTSVKIAIATVFLFLVAMYIGICVIEIATIDQLNEFLQAKPSDEDELKENCAAIKQQESFAPLLKSHAYFMCMFYILSLLLIVTLFVYHRFKIYKSIFPIPPQLQLEMNGVLVSLAFVSFTYILSNFGTTYVEASCGPYKLLSAEEIASLTLKYHWLCLIKFLDPILHPLILMKRMRVLRQIDLVWRSNFRLSSIFNATSGLNEFPVQRPIKTLKPKKSTYGWTGTSNPPNTKQAIDRELGSMLRILEEQRLGIHQ